MTTTPTLGTCFISYNHADKPLAEALLAGLTDLGYRVWIDERDLRVGDSLIGVISKAIGEVDFVAALVSGNSVASNWCQKEISLAMSEEIAGQGLTVLPCKVGDVDMPPSLKDKVYVSIEREQIDEAVQRLHRDMQGHLSGPAPLPPRRRRPSDASTSNADLTQLSGVAEAKQSIGNGTRPFSALDRLGDMHDAIAAIDALNKPKFDFPDNNAVARERRIEIFKATTDAAALTMFLCAHADQRDYKRAVDGMRFLGQWPDGHGGTTVLLAQQQAPGLLLLAAGAVGAVSEERWDLVADLLTSVRVMTQKGEAPLATGVDLGNALAGQTSFSQDHFGFRQAPTLLHDYLAAVNTAHRVMPRQAFEHAWERWEYLWHVATYNANGWLTGAPHLEIAGYSHNYEARQKGWADLLATTQSNLQPVLGEPGQARAFDSALAEIAQNAAWSTLPNGQAGFLPNSGWRISETGKYAVSAEERASWNDLFPNTP